MFELCLKQKSNSLTGFTLIEIMVTMAILGIALTVIIELFSGGLRLAKKSEDYSRAVFYGRQLLEEICLQEEIFEKEEEGEQNDTDPTGCRSCTGAEIEN